MHPTVDLVWNAPAHAWDILAGRVGDFGFEYRVARVRRLRRAGRDLEVRTDAARHAGPHPRPLPSADAWSGEERPRRPVEAGVAPGRGSVAQVTMGGPRMGRRSPGCLKRGRSDRAGKAWARRALSLPECLSSAIRSASPFIASCWLNPATIARAMSEVMRMRAVTIGTNSNSPSDFGRYMDVQNVKSWHWPTIGCSVM